MIKKIALLFLKVVIIIFMINFTYCGSNEDDIDTIPVISEISPSSKVVNMPEFTFRVKGSGFTELSKIYFDDIVRKTVFVSETELTCKIPAESIAAAAESNSGTHDYMTAETRLPVVVNNGGVNISDESFFTIREENLFTIPRALTEGYDNSYNPAITVDKYGNIFIVYDRYDRDSDTFFASIIKSDDGGNEWSEPTDIFASDQRVYNTDITTSNDGTLYFTFYNIRLYITRSDNSGETWSSPKIISVDTPNPIESKIGVDSDGNINILWILKYYPNDTSVYFQRSTDIGLTFSNAVNISSERYNFSIVYDLSLGVNDSGIYAGWTAWPLGGSKYSHVYFNYSNDSGQTWGSRDQYFGVSSASTISAGTGSNVYFALSNSYLPFQDNIVLYKSNDAGAGWGSRIDVTSDSTDAFSVIRTDNVGNLNIIYRRGKDYFYVRSIDGGVSWTDPYYFSDKGNNRSNEKLIDMVLDTEGNMYIVSEYDNIGILYFTQSY